MVNVDIVSIHVGFSNQVGSAARFMKRIVLKFYGGFRTTVFQGAFEPLMPNPAFCSAFVWIFKGCGEVGK